MKKSGDLENIPFFTDCIKNGSYDFIVIGAGSSGAVIANRLSEIDDWTVLVIEAGGEENLITDIPAEDRNLWLSDYNWGYVSTPQYNAMNGNSNLWFIYGMIC